MKILHISTSYVPAYNRGGPIVSIHNLCKQLVNLGHDITVYTTNSSLWDRNDLVLSKEIDVDGVRVFYFPVLNRNKFRYSHAMARALHHHLKGYQLVHLHGAYAFPPYRGAAESMKQHIPYVMTPRGSLMSDAVFKKSKIKKQVYIRLIAKKMLEEASAVHFTSSIEEQRTNELGLAPRKSVIVPNGIELPSIVAIKPNAFRQKYLLQDAIIVLFLSRINWKKGLDMLVPAFSRVACKFSNAHLVIAGPDNEGYGNKVRRWINEYGIEDRVTFTGLLKEDEKLQALVDSDIFVLPSYSENFANAPVEAMRAGVPIIVSNPVGMSEFIENGKDGFVVNTDVDEITDALVALVSDKSLRERMARNGIICANDKFGVEMTSKKIANLYEDILQ